MAEMIGISTDGTAGGDLYVSATGSYTGGAAATGSPVQVYTYPPNTTLNNEGLRSAPEQHADWNSGDRLVNPDGRLNDVIQVLQEQQRVFESRNQSLEEKLEAALHRIGELEERGSEAEIMQAQEIEQGVVLPVLHKMGKRERIKTVAKFVGSAALKAIISRIIKQTGVDLGWVLSLFK